MKRLIYLNPPTKIQTGPPRAPRYYRKDKDKESDIPKIYKKEGYGWKGKHWWGPEGKVLKNPRVAGKPRYAGVTLNKIIRNKNHHEVTALMTGLYDFFSKPETITGRILEYPVYIQLLLYSKEEDMYHDVDNRLALYRKAFLDVAHKPRHGKLWIPSDTAEFYRGTLGEKFIPSDENKLVVEIVPVNKQTDKTTEISFL